MKILKWFKNQIWLPSPGPRTGPGCRGRCCGCPRLHPRLPRTLAPGPGHHPRLLRTLSVAIGDASPKWAQDIFQGLSSWTFMCIYTVAATVIAVCIIVTSTSLTFTDVLYIWLLDGYTSGSMSLSCYSLAII